MTESEEEYKLKNLGYIEKMRKVSHKECAKVLAMSLVFGVVVVSSIAYLFDREHFNVLLVAFVALCDAIVFVITMLVVICVYGPDKKSEK